MNLSETYVIRRDGEISDYVFIDPSGRTHYRIPDRLAYEYAVSFSVASKISSNYPVVFEDLTTSNGEQLERIDYADVPAPIKRKLVAWLKLQPPPAAGPAGNPENPLIGPSSRGVSKSTGSDRIKDELMRAHPDTRAADWKRRTRTKEADGVHRRFEHADGRVVETVERPDGAIEIATRADGTAASGSEVPPAGTLMEWPDVEHSDVEIFVTGPRVDELAPGFESFDDNPDVVALFRHRDVYDEDGEYNGDGCDRLEMRNGILWAAIDGTNESYVRRIVEDCVTCAGLNPDLSYMVVGGQPVGDNEIQRYDVLFLKGFDAGSNPMRREHGKFYAEYVVRGI